EETERGGVRVVEPPSLSASYPENMRTLDRVRFERFRRRWLGNDPEAMAAILRMSSNPAFDLSADLARITAPTLIIGCTEDGIRQWSRRSPDRFRARSTSRRRPATSWSWRRPTCSPRWRYPS